MTQAEAGRLGGLATYTKYGRQEMVRRGKLGGRPQALTISQIRQLRAEQNKKKEDGLSTGNLAHLQRLYKLRCQVEASNRQNFERGEWTLSPQGGT
jgi:hypothetical protein